MTTKILTPAGSLMLRLAYDSALASHVGCRMPHHWKPGEYYAQLHEETKAKLRDLKSADLADARLPEFAY